MRVRECFEFKFTHSNFKQENTDDILKKLRPSVLDLSLYIECML